MHFATLRRNGFLCRSIILRIRSGESFGTMGSALVRKLMKRQAIAGSLVFRAWKNARQCWAENSHLDPTRAPAPLSPSKFLSNQADPPLRNWLTQVRFFPTRRDIAPKDH